MDVIAANLRRVAHDDPPLAVAKQAEAFTIQSSSIALKPNQEPARIHICCVLAVENLGEKYALSQPDTSKPPIPPAQYRKLLAQFRNLLLPLSAVRAAPAPRTPRKPRKTRSKVEDDDFVVDDDDMDEDEDEYEDHEEPEEFRTPSKRAPVGPRTGSPSPRKSPRKSPKKAGALTPTMLDTVGVKMGLSRATIDAVVSAHAQYVALVKDPWGLAYGLYLTVAERAEPKIGSENERRLNRAFGEVAPGVYVDRNEWVRWAEKIVAGQSWLLRIATKPEPSPPLCGAPGGWGLGVEFCLVAEPEASMELSTEPSKEPSMGPSILSDGPAWV